MTPHIDQQQHRFSERERSLAEAHSAHRGTGRASRPTAPRPNGSSPRSRTPTSRRPASVIVPASSPALGPGSSTATPPISACSANRNSTSRPSSDKVATEFARIISLRSEFHAAAAATRDRLRDAWAAVEAQRRRGHRLGRGRALLRRTDRRLDARAAELAKREKAVADQRTRGEAESVGLREETTALEARVENARIALAELEAQRDRIRAELLGIETPVLAMTGEPVSPAGRDADLAAKRPRSPRIKASLERETAEITDRKRVLSEQFLLLADARARWQVAERQTVIEMEEMARDLKQREADLDGRERRLIRDVRGATMPMISGNCGCGSKPGRPS